MSKTGRPTSNQGGLNGMVAGWTPHPVFSCQAPHQVHTWDFITANMSALLEKLRLSVSLFVSSCFFAFVISSVPTIIRGNHVERKQKKLTWIKYLWRCDPATAPNLPTTYWLTSLISIKRFFTFLKRASPIFLPWIMISYPPLSSWPLEQEVTPTWFVLRVIRTVEVAALE